MLLAFGEGMENRLLARWQVLQADRIPATWAFEPPRGSFGPENGLQVAFTAHRDSTLWTTSSVTVTASFSHWNLVWEPLLKTGQDGVYPIQEFRGAFRSDFRRALLSWTPMGAWTAVLGRAPVHFGESARFPLLFSEEAPPMELIGWQFRLGPVEFHHLLSQWPDVEARHTTFPGDTSRPRRAHRYLAFHGLALRFGNRLRVGFSEAFLYGGEMTFQLLYANPFTLYYTNQFNHYPMADGNILWLFHARARLFRGGQIYGEFLVDDFQYAPDRYHEPNHLAWLIGLEAAKGAWYGHAEYTKITAWVYNHFYAYDRFEIYGIPVGFPFGPDVETAWLRWGYRSGGIGVGLDLVWMVRGENRVTTPWPVPEDPQQEGYRFPQDNFLRGTPTRTVEASVVWDWAPQGYWTLRGKMGLLRYGAATAPVGELQLIWRTP